MKYIRILLISSCKCNKVYKISNDKISLEFDMPLSDIFKKVEGILLARLIELVISVLNFFKFLLFTPTTSIESHK